MLGIILFLIFGWYFLISAPNNFPEGAIVSIEKGENLKGLSFNLKEQHLIRSRIFFEAFVILYGGEKHIALGDYWFKNKLSVIDVAERIVKKDRQLASIKITIPEGYDLAQIAELASLKLKNFNAKNFLAKGQEGYLFPDTYFFFSTDTEHDVLKIMSENFEKKIKPLQNKIASSSKLENEIIVMASLVEREAKGDTDRGYISGILWNRLAKGMPLQVDANPETYKMKGLPANPICNPGIEAIRASISPVGSSYLYYLHDKNGTIHFARTFEEHKINKAKYLK